MVRQVALLLVLALAALSWSGAHATCLPHCRAKSSVSQASLCGTIGYICCCTNVAGTCSAQDKACPGDVAAARSQASRLMDRYFQANGPLADQCSFSGSGELYQTCVKDVVLPPVPTNNAPPLWGLNWGASRDPNNPYCPPANDLLASIRADFKVLKQVTSRLRTFSVDGCDAGRIYLQEAKRQGFKLWLGMWIGSDDGLFQNEYNYLKNKLIPLGLGNVEGIIVGSETLYRKEVTAEYVIRKMFQVRQLLHATGNGRILVTEADVWAQKLANPQLLLQEDWVSYNAFSYWEGYAIGAPATDVYEKHYRDIKAKMPAWKNYRIINTETGWPSAGPDFSNKNGVAVPSPANMKRYLTDITCLNRKNNLRGFWFNAFDGSNPASNPPGSVGNSWGLFTVDRKIKAPLTLPLRITC
eukprot:jgi/Chlat1/3778/Chrsp259S03915